MSIAIIGGSGLYDLDGLSKIQEHAIDTPYGCPSSAIIQGKLFEKDIFFLARHGKSHHLLPHELNHKANIWALKNLGVENIISFSAVGSLKENFHPCDFVLVDQYIDHTKRTEHTFFGNGAVAHISLAEPACEHLLQQVKESAIKIKKAPQQIHPAATYINIEGPQFSTRAESKLYRQWGMDVIGMTNFHEARLAREAEICYLTVAMVTDYDCWHQEHDAVTVEQVINNLKTNAVFAKSILEEIIPTLDTECTHGCRTSLQKGLLTPISAIPAKTKKILEPLIRKYL
jgi:5'-methylthioadenosine phosphorylase